MSPSWDSEPQCTADGMLASPPKCEVQLKSVGSQSSVGPVVAVQCDQLNGSLTPNGHAPGAMSPVPSSPTDSSTSSGLQPSLRSLAPSVSAPVLPAAHGSEVSTGLSSSKLSPDKDGCAVSPTSPKRQKVRKDRRFHKLFPDIAETDVVIKSYHCAYVSDILLQGFLYVTKNWFCFHSKLLGKKRIKICVENVTNITKTKTAIIIPNAVSIVTESNQQYVFGSLMSRDNTFRLLHGIWQQRIVDIEKASAIDLDVGSDATADVDSLTKSLNAVSSNSSTDDFVTSSSSDDNYCSDLAGSCDKLALVGTSLSSEAGFLSPVTPSPSSVDGADLQTVRRLADTSMPHYRRLYAGVRLKKIYMSFLRFMQWLNSLPRTSLFLLVSTVLVLLLLVSAGLLTYKLVHLQAQLDASLHSWTDNARYSQSPAQSQLSHSMYTLQHDYQYSTVQQIHAVLEAHVQLLDQVNEALKGLYSWASKSNPSLDSHSKHHSHPAASTSSGSSSGTTTGGQHDSL